jgi:hypothetical protein
VNKNFVVEGNIGCWLGRLAINFNFSGFTGIGGQSAGFKNAHGKQPFIYANF